jgi:atypical dual specificity phosphatase
MGRPDGLPEDFVTLREEGIGAVVNLMRQKWSDSMIAKGGMEYLHIPVGGFQRPTLTQMGQFVHFCERQVSVGRGVAVHCLAGKGRTGTMLACFLVSRGMAAEDAIAEVRRLRPGSLETRNQEAAVHEFSWHRR